MDEQEAIALLKQGDIGGLEALVALYQLRAVRAAYLVTRDPALAEDIVQAAFIRAYERIAQFDAARPFGPWFLRSVVNDAVKSATRQRPALPLDDDESPPLPDGAPSPEAILERAETRAAVWAALGQLPPEQRAAIVLRYYLGLKEREIAAEVGVPHGTVKWRLHAARQRLRDLLAPLRPAAQPRPKTPDNSV